ncbi:hypothetical protein [Hymenobacter perfusus]|uniref:Uncharacterized protein n=1 Tax=Hymenobacter perfusus TaxID=1236770 RepID=A0A3R9NPZ0_9BACT|nr:hypothetical protein [Hymenobacter perfusus]RSK40992.1 hypothetical protein EI293_18815 [Hymenobacter perfusus]
MKNTLFVTAGLLLAATAASAQISPSQPQRAGSMNQTTVQPQNPANPATNPGTLDQRTPTMSNPTQTVPGTIDQRPMTAPIVTPGEVRRTSLPTTAPATAPSRTTINSRRTRTVPGTATPMSTTPAGTTTPMGTTRP